MAEGNSRKAAAAAVAAVEASRRKPPDSLTLSNGIVLRLKPVPPYLVRQATMNVERPKVPTVFIPDKERDEENPNDPAYIDALLEYTQDTADAANNAVILAGTEIESVPEGLFWPQDDGWLEVLEFLGVEVERESKLGRYLDWMRFYALSTKSDLSAIWRAQRDRIGLTEEEVGAAAASFPNRAERRRNKRLSSEAAGLGDNVQTPSA